MPDIDPAESKRRVRSTALWAGLAAVIMLFCGYRIEWQAEGSLPRAGTLVFKYTLQIGGWVILAETLWLLTGARAALVCDGVVTVLVGVLLVLGGLLMTPGELLQAILFIVFGLLFIHSGLRSWRDARELLPASSGPSAGDGAPDTGPTDAAQPAADAPEPQAPDETTNRDAAAPGRPAEPPASEGYLSEFADQEQPEDER